MNLFNKHPNSIGESYFQHMRFAFTFGGKMVIGGLACIIHGIFPFLFESTGSTITKKLAGDFTARADGENNNLD